jgi:hypothetical protein
VQALLAAEGLAVPASWLTWWLPVSAIFSAGMAVVEGLAFAYTFSAWRNQKDKSASNLLWLTIISAVIFVSVLAPYIAASVNHTSLSEILNTRASLLAWSAAVAASTIAIVISVGYAQKATTVKDTDPALEKARQDLTELRRQFKESEAARAASEQRAIDAEARFAAAGDLFARLFAERKRERILAVAERWPSLQPSAIAVITETSPSYVSDVMKEVEVNV